MDGYAVNQDLSTSALPQRAASSVLGTMRPKDSVDNWHLLI